jgi:hypothetical protein
MNRFVLLLILLGTKILLLRADHDVVPSTLEKPPFDHDEEGRGQAHYWKRLGDDVWIPLSNLTRASGGGSDGSSSAPRRSAAASSIALSRTDRRLVVLSEGVAHVYDLREDGNRAHRYWHPIWHGPMLRSNDSQGNGSPTKPTATSGTGDGGTAVVEAAAISPNGLLLARHLVAFDDSSVSNNRIRRDSDDDIHKRGRSKSRRSDGRDSEVGRPQETSTSTIQVMAIADGTVLGSWTEPYSATSELSLVCLSDTRLVMEDRFLLVTCPSWNGQRGRAWLFQVLPVPLLVWEVQGESEGDKLGRSGDLDATSHEGVVRVALASPGYVQETGMVRIYDLRRESSDSDTPWTAEQVGRNLMGVTPGDGFGISVSLSHTGDGTVAIGSRKGVVHMVAFHRSPQHNGSTQSTFAYIVQEIEIPLNGDTSGRDPWPDLGSSLFNHVTVYLTPDALRLVASTETIGNVVVEKEKQVIVYNMATDDAGGAMRWMQVAYFRLNANELATTTGYSIATWLVDQIRTGSDNGSLWGLARVWLDRTPFCSTDVSCDVDPFLERRHCRTSRSVAADRDSCQSSAKVGSSTCTWVVEETTIGGSTNTVGPMVSPSESTSNPSAAPNAIQTEDPDIMTPLAACLCDRDLSCTSEPAAPDRDLRICVLGIPSRFKLKSFTSLYFQQDRIRYTVLDMDGNSIAGVASYCSDAVCHVVVPHWKSDLLTKGESNLLAAGTVALDNISPSKPPSMRRIVHSLSRLSAGEVNAAQGHFSAVIVLSREPCEQKAERVRVSFAFWIVLSFLLFVALLGCTCALRKTPTLTGEEGEQSHARPLTR